MKWILTTIALVNLAGSAVILLRRPELYEFTYALTDIALAALAVIAWFPKKQETPIATTTID